MALYKISGIKENGAAYSGKLLVIKIIWSAFSIHLLGTLLSAPPTQSSKSAVIQKGGMHSGPLNDSEISNSYKGNGTSFVVDFGVKRDVEHILIFWG